jgi:hypothetical protein
VQHRATLWWPGWRWERRGKAARSAGSTAALACRQRWRGQGAVTPCSAPARPGAVAPERMRWRARRRERENNRNPLLPSPLNAAGAGVCTLQLANAATGAWRRRRTGAVGAVYSETARRRSHGRMGPQRGLPGYRTPENRDHDTWPTRLERTRVLQSAVTTSVCCVSISFTCFQNCETPKIVN